MALSELSEKIDHTCEVERRLAAILISEDDGCDFFKARNGFMLRLSQCKYCTWAVFDTKNQEPGRSGLCKFKR